MYRRSTEWNSFSLLRISGALVHTCKTKSENQLIHLQNRLQIKKIFFKVLLKFDNEICALFTEMFKIHSWIAKLSGFKSQFVVLLVRESFKKCYTLQTPPTQIVKTK